MAKWKKGVEWHMMLMLIFGVLILLVLLYITAVFKGGSESIFSKLLERLRFG